MRAYRLKAGFNNVEAVPSAAAWARAVPAIAALRPGFLDPSAVILAGKSTNPDFDIAQLQATQQVREHSFSGRLDLKMNNRWSSYMRVFHDQGTSDQPEGVSGRVVHITDNPTSARCSTSRARAVGRTVDEFQVRIQRGEDGTSGQAPTVNGIDFSKIVLNLSGSVANTGIAGQGASSGIVVPGGLVRSNSATNGHAQPYDPYVSSFTDSVSSVSGNHYLQASGALPDDPMAARPVGRRHVLVQRT